LTIWSTSPSRVKNPPSLIRIQSLRRGLFRLRHPGQLYKMMSVIAPSAPFPVHPETAQHETPRDWRHNNGLEDVQFVMSKSVTGLGMDSKFKPINQLESPTSGKGKEVDQVHVSIFYSNLYFNYSLGHVDFQIPCSSNTIHPIQVPPTNAQHSLHVP